MQKDCEDPIASMEMAFAPAIEAGIPWAAVLGNHDQEGNLSREGVMSYITSMDYTVARVNPSSDGCGLAIDGFGNYVLEIFGAEGSPQAGKSVMNLYLVDSGDYAPLSRIGGYGWIHETQSTWIKKVAKKLQVRAAQRIYSIAKLNNLGAKNHQDLQFTSENGYGRWST